MKEDTKKRLTAKIQGIILGIIIATPVIYGLLQPEFKVLNHPEYLFIHIAATALTSFFVLTTDIWFWSLVEKTRKARRKARKEEPENG